MLLVDYVLTIICIEYVVSPVFSRRMIQSTSSFADRLDSCSINALTVFLDNRSAYVGGCFYQKVVRNYAVHTKHRKDIVH